MRHADDDLPAHAGCVPDFWISRSSIGIMVVATFAGEALLADVLGAEIALQRFGGSEPLEDVRLLKLRRIARRACGSARSVAGESG